MKWNKVLLLIVILVGVVTPISLCFGFCPPARSLQFKDSFIFLFRGKNAPIGASGLLGHIMPGVMLKTFLINLSTLDKDPADVTLFCRLLTSISQICIITLFAGCLFTFSLISKRLVVPSSDNRYICLFCDFVAFLTTFTGSSRIVSMPPDVPCDFMVDCEFTELNE